MWLTKVIYARASLLRPACMRHRLLFIIYARSQVPGLSLSLGPGLGLCNQQHLAATATATKLAGVGVNGKQSGNNTVTTQSECVCGKLARIRVHFDQEIPKTIENKIIRKRKGRI